MNDEYLSIQDAAKEYGWSRPMLYKFHQQNKLTFYKLPGKRGTLIKRADLDALSQPVEKR